MLKILISSVFVSALAMPVLAAGGDGNSAPKPTQTTKECKKNKVWSEKKKRCVNPENSGLSEDALYDAVRELAHAGRLDEAQIVLSAMTAQNDDRVMTYWGFTHRKLGNIALGMMFYDRALDANPDNLLARSYLGQAHVEAGDITLARAQLGEIRARGGANTWAATSLASAIQTGITFNY